MSNVCNCRWQKMWAHGCLALLIASGCGGDKPLGGKFELAEASGKVTFQGSPLVGATVQAIPKDGPLATGVTDMEGKFTLSTGPNKGVAVGQIKVAVRGASATSGNAAGNYDPTKTESVTDAMRKFHEQQGGANQKPKAEDTGIPAIYSNAETSGLVFQIKSGEENNLPIDLK